MGLFKAAVLLLALCCACWTADAGLFDKKKDNEKREDASDLLAGWRDTNSLVRVEAYPSDLAHDEEPYTPLMTSVDDPQALRELAKMAQDPKVMAEVRELMDDPAFRAEMEKIVNSDAMKRGMKHAEQMVKDPEKLASFQRDFTKVLEANRQPPKFTPQQSAQLGVQTLTQSVQDPSLMRDAMKMMNDPETKAQVEELMKDPEFQVEMKRITESPMFKKALANAKDMTDEIAKDPRKMKAFMAEVEGAMGALKRDEL